MRHTSIIAPILAVLAASVALFACFPPLGFGWLAWVALIPLIWFSTQAKLPSSVLGGWLFGVVAYLAIFCWLNALPGYRLYHGVLLAAVFALFPATWAGIVNKLNPKTPWFAVHVAAVWTALDYVRDHLGFLALPWVSLAATQTDNLAVLQLGRWGGAYLITFVVCATSAALFRAGWLRAWRSLVPPMVLVAVLHGVGFLAIADVTPTTRVAIVQPAFAPGSRKDATAQDLALNMLEYQTLQVASTLPDLVVWPESAIAGPGTQRDLHAWLKNVSVAAHAPLLVGATEVEKFQTAAGAMSKRLFNTANLIQPTHAEQQYRKQRLLPFGEYMPMPDLFAWPQWLAPAVVELSPGLAQAPLTVGGQLRIGVLICWESLFADDARQSIQDGARMLVVLSNDAWFHSESAARQHNLAAVLRAAELGVPVLVASNSGPSQLIDHNGQVLKQLPYQTEGTLVGDLAIPPQPSVYAWTGDLFAYVTLVWAACICFGRVVGRSTRWAPVIAGGPDAHAVSTEEGSRL